MSTLADLVTYDCDVCKKQFTTAGNLKNHKLNHSDIKLYKCGLCEKQFTQAGNLRKHERIHSGIKPHRCGVCDKTFTQAVNLKQHILIHSDIKRYQCRVCGKQFTQASTLTQHKVVHSDVKPSKCGVCQKHFTRAKTLKQHMFVHSNIKPHISVLCGRKFTLEAYLKRHMVIHSDIKPYQCQVCNKQFCRSGTLKRHNLLHSGVLPYKCEVCQKHFTRAGALKQHMLIHSDVKPHTCRICGKQFTQTFFLKRHKLIHSGVQIHHCRVCRNLFILASSLQQHMLIHHSGIELHRQVSKKQLAPTNNPKLHEKLHQIPHRCDACMITFNSEVFLNKHMCCNKRESVTVHISEATQIDPLNALSPRGIKNKFLNTAVILESNMPNEGAIQFEETLDKHCSPLNNAEIKSELPSVNSLAQLSRQTTESEIKNDIKKEPYTVDFFLGKELRVPICRIPSIEESSRLVQIKMKHETVYLTDMPGNLHNDIEHESVNTEVKYETRFIEKTQSNDDFTGGLLKPGFDAEKLNPTSRESITGMRFIKIEPEN